MLSRETYIHHYSPERRIRPQNVTIVRQANDPYIICEKEADVIYDKVRRLLNTAEIWLDYSVADDDITEQMVQALHIGIDKSLTVVTKDIDKLISKHHITDKDDVAALKDVAVQLQEIADKIFSNT